MKKNRDTGTMSGKKRRQLLPLLLCLPFGFLFYICKYVLPGYSFTALVCLCVIGVILFYTLMPLVPLLKVEVLVEGFSSPPKHTGQALKPWISVWAMVPLLAPVMPEQEEFLWK